MTFLYRERRKNVKEFHQIDGMSSISNPSLDSDSIT